jgi:Flp pilus assembly protein TadG
MHEYKAVKTQDPGRALKSRRGSNIIEFSFFVPWFIFLFVGTLDCGFYIYSLISVETAAEQGALYCSTNSATAVDTATACSYALDTLRKLPNVGNGITTCGSGSVSSSAPVAVTASSVSSGADGNSAASVQVMYLTPQLIPIPCLMAGQLTINRTVQFRIRS